MIPFLGMSLVSEAIQPLLVGTTDLREPGAATQTDLAAWSHVSTHRAGVQVPAGGAREVL